MDGAAHNLGIKLRAKFDEAKADRRMYEKEWLKDLRQYQGVYDPEVDRRIPKDRSHAFIRLTRSKVKTMDARIGDMLFPAGAQRNWSLKPIIGKQPQRPPQQAPQQPGFLRRLIGAGQPQSEEHDLIAQLKERADGMAREMAMQLADTHYQRLARKVVHSGNLYGTGVLKGPLVEQRAKGEWAMQDGAFVYVEVDAFRPYLEYVPIWDVYPEMAGNELPECEFVFQRHVMNRADVRKLARRKGFDGECIAKYLREHPDGDADYTNAELQRRGINGKEDAAKRGKRYEVLEYWGYIDGNDLVECGCELPEDLEHAEFEANIWLLGDQVIKAALNPFDAKLRPFQFYLFERDETGVFGIGVASILRDTQTVFNAAVRASIDNAAMSAGPMIEVNQALLADGEDPYTIAPFRVWLRKGNGEESRAPAVRSYTVANNTRMLLQLAQAFKEMGDEASAIPAYIQGEGASEAGRTMGGLSMLMGAANITLKDTVANFDDGVTKPVISALYQWNMQFHQDDQIKGNYDVVVRGSESLVAKEIRARQLAELPATLTPQEATYIDWEALLRERLRANELNDEGLLVDEDTVKQRQAVQAKQPNPDLLKIQNDRFKAQTGRFEAQHDARIDEAKVRLEARKMALDQREQEIEAREAELNRLAEMQQDQMRWGQPDPLVESGEYFPPPHNGY